MHCSTFENSKLSAVARNIETTTCWNVVCDDPSVNPCGLEDGQRKAVNITLSKAHCLARTQAVSHRYDTVTTCHLLEDLIGQSCRLVLEWSDEERRSCCLLCSSTAIRADVSLSCIVRPQLLATTDYIRLRRRILVDLRAIVVIGLRSRQRYLRVCLRPLSLLVSNKT